MRPGPIVVIASLVLLGCFSKVDAQEAQGDAPEIQESQVTRQSGIMVGQSLVVQVQISDQGLPDKTRGKIVLWTGACAFLAAMAAYFSRQLEWQKLSENKTCAHCLAVHQGVGSLSLLCDYTTVTSLVYLFFLPFAAALVAEPIAPSRVGIVALLFTALIVLLIACGAAMRRIVRVKISNSQTGLELTQKLLIGARTVGFLCAAALLSQGFGIDSFASQFNSLFGASLGERLMNSIGTDVLRDTATTLLLSITLSSLLRWVIPLLFGSRPLILLRPDGRNHRSSRLART